MVRNSRRKLLNSTKLTGDVSIVFFFPSRFVYLNFFIRVLSAKEDNPERERENKEEKFNNNNKIIVNIKRHIKLIHKKKFTAFWLLNVVLRKYIIKRAKWQMK